MAMCKRMSDGFQQRRHNVTTMSIQLELYIIYRHTEYKEE